LLSAPTVTAATYVGGSTGINDALLVTVPVLASTAAITGFVALFAKTAPLAVKIVHFTALAGAVFACVVIFAMNVYSGNAAATVVFGLVPAFCATAAVCMFFYSRIDDFNGISTPLL
jgi:CHASE2 domain-containing sensor protein